MRHNPSNMIAPKNRLASGINCSIITAQYSDSFAVLREQYGLQKIGYVGHDGFRLFFQDDGEEVNYSVAISRGDETEEQKRQWLHVATDGSRTYHASKKAATEHMLYVARCGDVFGPQEAA